MHPLHHEILQLIIADSGQVSKDTFLEKYLGNHHVRYEITTPALRNIAKTWMKDHRGLKSADLVSLISSLIKGESYTEKIVAGMLLDYATPDQRRFDPNMFDEWLDHLEGWAEIDTLCTGEFMIKEIPSNLSIWDSVLKKLSHSPAIGKRRASLVLLTSPVGHSDDQKLAKIAIRNIEQVKHEKDILITKAVSWLLRSMIKLHREAVENYLDQNRSSLPSIAVRETKAKLETGTKTRRI